MKRKEEENYPSVIISKQKIQIMLLGMYRTKNLTISVDKQPV
jgi:predicted aspartyl protease